MTKPSVFQLAINQTFQPSIPKFAQADNLQAALPWVPVQYESLAVQPKEPPGANAQTYKVDDTSLGWNYLYTFEEEGSKKDKLQMKFLKELNCRKRECRQPIRSALTFWELLLSSHRFFNKIPWEERQEPFLWDRNVMKWCAKRIKGDWEDRIDRRNSLINFLFALSLCTPSRIEITYLESQTLSVHKQFPNRSCSSRHFFQTTSEW